MKCIRRRALRLLAISILLAAVLLVTKSAAAQSLDTNAENDSRPPAGPRNEPFVIVLGVVPIATYAAAAGPQSSQMFYPADRFATTQIVGGGCVVNPRFRFGANAIPCTPGVSGIVPASFPLSASTTSTWVPCEM